jgi:hypothetical protein
MAFEEVTLTEEEKAALSATFVKFEAIGDQFGGVFVSSRSATGQYAKPGQIEYIFRRKDPTSGEISEVLFNPPTDAAQKLKKAALKPGNRVAVKYVSDQDVGKESPMKIFKVMVDRATAAAPAPAPKPALKAENLDDIQF